jgi:hypothetical protein
MRRLWSNHLLHLMHMNRHEMSLVASNWSDPFPGKRMAPVIGEVIRSGRSSSQGHLDVNR